VSHWCLAKHLDIYRCYRVPFKGDKEKAGFKKRVMKSNSRAEMGIKFKIAGPHILWKSSKVAYQSDFQYERLYLTLFLLSLAPLLFCATSISLNFTVIKMIVRN
jgi:hypothetical protein